MPNGCSGVVLSLLAAAEDLPDFIMFSHDTGLMLAGVSRLSSVRQLGKNVLVFADGDARSAEAPLLFELRLEASLVCGPMSKLDSARLLDPWAEEKVDLKPMLWNWSQYVCWLEPDKQDSTEVGCCWPSVASP